MKRYKIILLIILIVLLISGVVYGDYLLNSTQVTYNKNGNTITVKSAIDELYTKVKPKVGELVNYNANAKDASGTAFTTPYSYTLNTTNSSANDYTGGDTSATFKSDDAMTWKVLDINQDTGKILLMAADDFAKTVQLKGPAGYAYSVNVLNKVSEVYGHGYGAEYARSITVEDINRVIGYNPVREGFGKHTKTYTAGNYYVKLTFTDGKVTGYTRNASNNNVTSDKKHYWYLGTDYLSSSSNSYKMIFYKNGTTNNRYYWNASQDVFFGTEHSDFRVRNIENGEVHDHYLCSSEKDQVYTYSMSACPVVYLKSNTRLTWDNANNRWNINPEGT